MKKPIVSVIIPCSRPKLAQGTVKSILKQDYPLDKIEIVLAGKNCQIKDKRTTIKTIRGKFYPGQARNMGAKVAKGEYFLFVDDDCEVEKDWIAENLKALDNRKIGAVSGMVIGKADNFFARCTDFSNFDLCQTKQKCERVLCSATMGTRKEVFEKTEGFDAGLRVGEDIDFCYKLIKLGYKTLYEPKIKVFHDHRQDTLWKIMNYMYFGGRKSGLLSQKKYPEFNQGPKILSFLQSPYLFAPFIFPISFLMTLKSFSKNFAEHKKVFFYLPVIFFAKLSYNMGVLFWLIEKRKKVND